MKAAVISRKGGVGKSTTALHLAGYLAKESSEDVVVVDTDPSRNAKRYADRGDLPFRVIGEDEVELNPEIATTARHLVVDMRGSPSIEELEAVMTRAEVMILPLMPSALALDTLLQTRRDLHRLGRQDRYKVLLTAVPPWPYRRGPQAREALGELGIPMFEGEIGRLEAFEAAADAGVLISGLQGKRARRGWEDYSAVGEELIDWVTSIRTSDLSPEKARS